MASMIFQCDNCGTKRLTGSLDSNVLAQAERLRALGWLATDDGEYAVCPGCAADAAIRTRLYKYGRQPFAPEAEVSSEDSCAKCGALLDGVEAGSLCARCAGCAA
jgi:hypothetical protein